MNFWENKLKQHKMWALGLSSSFMIALLAGCGTFDELNEKGKIDYRSAGKRPTLEVPPDLTAPTAVDRGTSASEFAKQNNDRAGAAPASAAVLAPVPGVKIERAGAQRWLAVDMAPDAVWKALQEFWPDNGFSVLVQSAQTGIMETDWAENRAKIPNDGIRSIIGKALDSLYSTGERDKFRLRIEPNAAGTEIYVSHKGMREVLTGGTKDVGRWEPRGSGNDPELEVEFMRRIALRLGADKARAEQVAATAKAQGPTAVNTGAPTAAAVPVSTKVKLVGTGATGVLELNEDGFDRSWRRVGIALDKGGFTVEDRDRSKGQYFVRYLDPELEAKSGRGSGVFGKLFSSDGDMKPRTFRVGVKQNASVANVSVSNQDGSVITDATDQQVATRILSLLQDQLK
jgi:outer membrane protein assembly factor BamC